MKSLFPLLQAIATDTASLDTSEISDELLDFSINAGVAGLLQYYSKKNITHNSRLISAELTAKIITHTQLQALKEILEANAAEITEIILLKGISTCQEYYPKPHLRIMSDIDLLVSEENIKKLESVLSNSGYRQTSDCSDEYYSEHHHSMPFYNKQNNVWIEVHRHLFSQPNPVLNDELFRIDNILKQTIPTSYYRSMPEIKRLSAELQLVYTCNHWCNNIKLHKSCAQIIDIIFIIKSRKDELFWSNLFELTNNTLSASNITLILSFLNKRDIIQLPESYIDSFDLKYNNMFSLNRWILHKIINNLMLGENNTGKILTENNISIIWSTLLLPSSSLYNLLRLPWNIAFPPNLKDRYKLSLLLLRIRNMLFSK